MFQKNTMWLELRVYGEKYMARESHGERNGTPLRYSCLENPMNGGAWWAAVHGVARSRTRLSDRKVTSTTDGKTRMTWYDAWGNVKKVQEPYGSVTYTYNSNGKPATASTGNGVVSLNYDENGNKVSLVDPDAGTMTYSYNAAGQVISQTDARGITTTQTLDALNRTVSTTTGTTVVNYTYGTTGNASQRLTGVSTPTHGIFYTYDSIGRVSSETRNFGSTQYVFPRPEGHTGRGWAISCRL